MKGGPHHLQPDLGGDMAGWVVILENGTYKICGSIVGVGAYTPIAFSLLSEVSTFIDIIYDDNMLIPDPVLDERWSDYGEAGYYIVLTARWPATAPEAADENGNEYHVITKLNSKDRANQVVAVLSAMMFDSLPQMYVDLREIIAEDVAAAAGVKSVDTGVKLRTGRFVDISDTGPVPVVTESPAHTPAVVRMYTAEEYVYMLSAHSGRQYRLSNASEYTTTNLPQMTAEARAHGGIRAAAQMLGVGVTQDDAAAAVRPSMWRRTQQSDSGDGTSNPPPH